MLSFVHRPLPIHNKYRVHRVHRIIAASYIYFDLEMTTSLKITSALGALVDVDRGTWVKACLGVGATAVLVRLVKARLEKKAYWARWAVFLIYMRDI